VRCVRIPQRSDPHRFHHGANGGPSPVDYSTCITQRVVKILLLWQGEITLHRTVQAKIAEMIDAPRVSLAIPVYNEEAVLPELLQRTAAVLDDLPGGPHEIVIVDDGSLDRTQEILETAAHQDSRLLIVALSRNFGHQTALAAALDHVSGDVVVLMDGDLQDPPEAIPTLVDTYRQGYEVVYVQRKNRKEEWWLRLCYFAFYRLMTVLSPIKLPVDAGDFGLMSRRVVDEIRRMPEHHRYLRGLRSWVGFRQIGIPVERAARNAGRTKYGPVRLLKLASDGIFAFSIVPLRAAAIMGAIAIALSFLFTLYAVYARFWLHSPQGFTAQIVVTTFLSGVNLFFLGIIGEYIGRIYEGEATLCGATSGRPPTDNWREGRQFGSRA
jgi:polyisoprenyl-phosphate glycosyltransferase